MRIKETFNKATDYFQDQNWYKPFLLLFSIVLLSLGVSFLIFARIQAYYQLPIVNLAVTNISDTSVTIIWRSEKAVCGGIIFIDSERTGVTDYVSALQGKNVFNDSRVTTKPCAKKSTHQVTITNLSPSTSYSFRTVHNGVIHASERQYFFTTLPTESKIPEPLPIYGKVFSDSVEINDSIVIISLATFDNNGVIKAETGYRSSEVKDNSYVVDISSVFNDEISREDFQRQKAELFLVTKLISTKGIYHFLGDINQIQPVPNINLSDYKESKETVDEKEKFNNLIKINLRDSINTIFQEANEIETGDDDFTDYDLLPSSIYVGISGWQTSGNLTNTLINRTKAFNDEIVDSGSYVVKGRNVHVTTPTIDIPSPATIKYFYDSNGNGIMDANEKILTDNEQQAVEIELEKRGELMLYYLNSGWNTVSFPLLMRSPMQTEITKASQLFQYLLSKGIEIFHISVYREGNFLIYSQRISSDGTINYYGNDFEIRPGEGYFIKASEGSVFSLTGLLPSNYQTIELQKGWNLVGVFNSRRTSYTAYELIEIMKENDISVSMISKWDKGRYQNLIKRDDMFGNNFDILPNQSYWIQVEQDSMQYSFELK